ncbi:MAG: hypothetical protein EBU92_08185 [Betaproteobacteria bacterium]|nr:hypothetical protein [Betaproteobacteria bacterium]
MADNSGFHFDNFLPGFDFLKQFAQANPAAAMPTAAQWVTPTLDHAELDKRIQDLKSVQFWLDQNAKALSATIQALEVQRMTLTTLQSMNVGMADVAAAMSGKTAAASDKKSDAPGQSPIDPMQWWNVIGQQFQTIASQAVADMQTHSQAFTAAAKPAKTERTASPAAPGKSTTRQTAARKSSTAKPRKTSRQ